MIEQTIGTVGCIRCACMQDTANASATLSKTTPERANAQGRARARPRWRVDEIDFSHAQTQHRSDTTLFYLLATSSFIESGSELYTRNLLAYYGSDVEVADWLRRVWEPEELQHAVALRGYIGAVWPDFDWPKAYEAFLTEYARVASPDAFEATTQLELAARCMIETGTTSLYQTLLGYAQEPVLRQVLKHIRDDEVDHYKYFLRFFRAEQARAGQSRIRVAWAIARRVLESRSDDARIAFRHAFETNHPERRCTGGDFDQWQSDLKTIFHRAFPFHQAAGMLLAPVALPPFLQRLARSAAEAALRHALLSQKY